jgi:amidase
MTNTLSGITTFMKSVIATRPWMKDPYVVRKAWDEDAYRLSEHGGPGSQLCIAFVWHNGQTLPTPPITRGLSIVKEALVAAGHKVIDLELPRAYELQMIVVSSLISTMCADCSLIAN